MLTGSVEGLGVIDAILDRLRRLEQLDLRPLAATISKILVDDNRAGLLAGIDADGQAMAPLAARTLAHRTGSGPPGVPTSASSLVAGFVASVEISPAGLTIHAGFRDGAKARFFSRGTQHQPARNLDGLRPETRAKVQQALTDFARAASAGL